MVTVKDAAGNDVYTQKDKDKLDESIKRLAEIQKSLEEEQAKLNEG